MKHVVLSNEDFQDFPIGEFPYDKDHTAMGEYQYVVANGYHGNWVDMVCNSSYNGTGPTWLITERDGRHFMESMRIEKNRPHRMFPTLETGKHQWKDYEVSVSVRRLSQKGMAGLVFSMNHSIDTLVFYLDGRTGTIKKSAKTPFSDDDDADLIGVPYQTYAFERINPDGIRICNFRGKERPADILIKDRYCRIYALDEDLNMMWKFKSPTNTGHCPLPIDIDGDGKDELLVGYKLLDSDGQMLWSYPISEDHTDEIVAGKWMPGEDEGHFACVSGKAGFFIGDFYGNIVARDMVGHAQRVSIANYCPEREGREIVVTNYWGHQGVIFLYDCYGNQIWEMENEMNGNILAPVNWDGDGTELILTNADAKKGGLLNGRGVRAVEFPDDGHPVLCCESLDLTGDERNELVVWDYHSMYIYTQDDCPKEQTYHPVQFPIYNASNYRGEYSYPDASYLDFHADKEKMKANRK